MQNEKMMNEESEENEENEDLNIKALNYKKGYTFLFNGISDMINLSAKMLKQMMILQKQSEELCISETSVNIEISTEAILELIVEKIKKNMEESEND